MRTVLFLVFGSLLSAFWAPVAQPQEHVQTRIVSDTELVRIPVIIFDNKGAVATNLQKTDFRLSEDGVEQTVLRLDRERVPVSFVILADLSSSMTRKLPFVRDAALSLLDPSDEDDQSYDEYSVLGIGKRSRLLMPFTRDEQDVEKKLPLLLTATNESTALLDGVWLGVSTAEQDSENQHRVLIIITDGGDNHSRYTLRETTKLLQEADVPVFAIMAGPSFELPAFLSMPEDNPIGGKKTSDGGSSRLPLNVQVDDYIGPAERRGPHNMKVLTEASGGGVFTARHEEDLARIVQTIGLAVRYRYVLTYVPVRESLAKRNRGRDAKFHKILIELHPSEKFAGYSMPYYKHGYNSVE
jgi:VWFA-related protein